MTRGRIAAVATAVLLVAAGLSLPARPAGAFVSDTVSADPAPGSHVDGRGVFVLTAHPGDVITQTLLLSNPHTHSVDVRVGAVDAGTSEQLGEVFATPGSPQARTSRWITPAVPELNLAANTKRRVDFTVRVPAGTPPGEYVAGVNAYVPLTEHTTLANPGAKKAAIAIDTQIQRVIAVEITVPGPRAPQMAVTGADPEIAGNHIVIGVHMANAGNDFAHGSGVVRVADTNTDETFKILKFVPGTAVVFPAPWNDTVQPGRHHVEVDINYDGGRRLSWTGTITVSAAQAGNLEKGLAHVHISAKSGGIPWLLIAALVLLLLLIAAAVTVRRRSRETRRVKYRAA